MANTETPFVLFRDSRGEWRWTLYSASRTRIADSAESYLKKEDVVRAIDQVCTVVSGSPAIWDPEVGNWINKI
ncbi:MAG: DUF1508 domain-containing protein [Rhodanobacteraceae bacterium]|nr:DUF1508 domain-containing protein [Rhodanobacteraceae bacterium]